jgi:hypothetical protein
LSGSEATSIIEAATLGARQKRCKGFPPAQLRQGGNRRALVMVELTQHCHDQEKEPTRESRLFEIPLQCRSGAPAAQA